MYVPCESIQSVREGADEGLLVRVLREYVIFQILFYGEPLWTVRALKPLLGPVAAYVAVSAERCHVNLRAARVGAGVAWPGERELNGGVVGV